MSDFNSAYWTKRYQEGATGWDAGTVTPPLKAYFDQLQNKDLKILIPGAGNAHEAEYLVSKGFTNVYVCDLAIPPLQNLKKRCPLIPDEHLILGDFFELENNQFDLIVEQTFFCAIDPSLRKKYFQKMLEVLKPEGILVGVLFDDLNLVNGPPFGGNKAEYLTYIPTDFQTLHLESCYNSMAPRAGRELFMELQKKV